MNRPHPRRLLVPAIVLLNHSMPASAMPGMQWKRSTRNYAMLSDDGGAHWRAQTRPALPACHVHCCRLRDSCAGQTTKDG
jgi:hypothetical protein